MVHYIPHHEELTPQKTTTKLCIIFDGSAWVKHMKSLNEFMYRGPVLIEYLCGLLIHFYLHETALIGDIEKAFLQIGLNIPDRDVTRFTWLKNPSDPLDIDIHWFSTLCRPVHVTAWCMRFTVNLKGEQQRSPLTATEMDIAKTQWLKQVQSKHFSRTDEKTRNLMRQLNVRIDETGLMRCYSRICNAELPTSTVSHIHLP